MPDDDDNAQKVLSRVLDNLDKLKVLDDEPRMDHMVLVCVLATAETPFTDNVLAECCECGVGLQHRPHARGRPHCYECVLARQDPEFKPAITQKAAEEFLALIAKKEKAQ